MTYVLDNGCFREMEGYYVGVFETFWALFQQEVEAENVISVREVLAELDRAPDTPVKEWAFANRSMFLTPTSDEGRQVAAILTVPHFRQIISTRAQLSGTPVADPFVIASALVRRGTVVTQERRKPNSAKMPNICDHFDVRCINFEGFLTEMGWKF